MHRGREPGQKEAEVGTYVHVDEARLLLQDRCMFKYIHITPVNRIIYQNISSLDYALVGTRRDNETRRQTLRTNSGVTRVVVGEHFCM